MLRLRLQRLIEKCQVNFWADEKCEHAETKTRAQKHDHFGSEIALLTKQFIALDTFITAITLGGKKLFDGFVLEAIKATMINEAEQQMNQLVDELKDEVKNEVKTKIGDFADKTSNLDTILSDHLDEFKGLLGTIDQKKNFKSELKK